MLYNFNFENSKKNINNCFDTLLNNNSFNLYRLNLNIEEYEKDITRYFEIKIDDYVVNILDSSKYNNALIVFYISLVYLVYVKYYDNINYATMIFRINFNKIFKVVTSCVSNFYDDIV